MTKDNGRPTYLMIAIASVTIAVIVAVIVSLVGAGVSFMLFGWLTNPTNPTPWVIGGSTTFVVSFLATLAGVGWAMFRGESPV